MPSPKIKISHVMNATAIDSRMRLFQVISTPGMLLKIIMAMDEMIRPVLSSKSPKATTPIVHQIKLFQSMRMIVPVLKKAGIAIKTPNPAKIMPSTTGKNPGPIRCSWPIWYFCPYIAANAPINIMSRPPSMSR